MRHADRHADARGLSACIMDMIQGSQKPFQGLVLDVEWGGQSGACSCDARMTNTGHSRFHYSNFSVLRAHFQKVRGTALVIRLDE